MTGAYCPPSPGSMTASVEAASPGPGSEPAQADPNTAAQVQSKDRANPYRVVMATTVRPVAEPLLTAMMTRSAHVQPRRNTVRKEETCEAAGGRGRRQARRVRVPRSERGGLHGRGGRRWCRGPVACHRGDV